MSHYEKLAVLLFRVIGCSVTIYALIAVAYVFVSLFLFGGSFGLYFIAAVTYAIVGLALFALSKPLAALIARKL